MININRGIVNKNIIDIQNINLTIFRTWSRIDVFVFYSLQEYCIV